MWRVSVHLFLVFDLTLKYNAGQNAEGGPSDECPCKSCDESAGKRFQEYNMVNVLLNKKIKRGWNSTSSVVQAIIWSEPCSMVNGNTDSRFIPNNWEQPNCFVTHVGDVNPWLFVDLDTVVTVHRLDIYRRKEKLYGIFHDLWFERMMGLNITVDAQLCFGTTLDLDTLDRDFPFWDQFRAHQIIPCYKPIAGQYVSIYKPYQLGDYPGVTHVLAICELEIYVCKKGYYINPNSFAWPHDTCIPCNESCITCDNVIGCNKSVPANVALAKKSFSNIAKSNDINDWAVDGYIDVIRTEQRCLVSEMSKRPHTLQWWRVDLLTKVGRTEHDHHDQFSPLVKVLTVRVHAVYPRYPSYANMTVYVDFSRYNTTFDIHLIETAECGSFLTHEGEVNKTLSCTDPVERSTRLKYEYLVGRYVTITQYLNEGQQMVLCEVLVFGIPYYGCKAGSNSYGHGCARSCGHCAYRVECNNITGYCLKGRAGDCRKGFIAPRCHDFDEAVRKSFLLAIPTGATLLLMCALALRVLSTLDYFHPCPSVADEEKLEDFDVEEIQVLQAKAEYCGPLRTMGSRKVSAPNLLPVSVDLSEKKRKRKRKGRMRDKSAGDAPAFDIVVPRKRDEITRDQLEIVILKDEVLPATEQYVTDLKYAVFPAPQDSDSELEVLVLKDYLFGSQANDPELESSRHLSTRLKKQRHKKNKGRDGKRHGKKGKHRHTKRKHGHRKDKGKKDKKRRREAGEKEKKKDKKRRREAGEKEKTKKIRGKDKVVDVRGAGDVQVSSSVSEILVMLFREPKFLTSEDEVHSPTKQLESQTIHLDDARDHGELTKGKLEEVVDTQQDTQALHRLSKGRMKKALLQSTSKQLESQPSTSRSQHPKETPSSAKLGKARKKVVRFPTT